MHSRGSPKPVCKTKIHYHEDKTQGDARNFLGIAFVMKTRISAEKNQVP